MRNGIVLVVLLVVASAFAQERTGGYLHSDGQVPMNGNFRLKSFYLSNDGDNEGISVSTAGNVTVSGTLSSGAFAPSSISTPGAAIVGGNLTVTGDVTTAAGTVSAEQLTSTDDATIADDLNVTAGPVLVATDAAELGSSSDDGYLTLRGSAGETDAKFSADAVSFFNGGNVGIGTNAPADLLTLVNGSTDSSMMRLQTHAANGAAGMVVQNDANLYTTYINESDSYVIRDGTASADRITILSTGLVGIGTNTPAQVLHVRGNAAISAVGMETPRLIPVAGDTDAQLIQSSNQVADASHTIWTNTFPIAFANGKAPFIQATYTEDPGDVRPIFVTGIASNVCLFNVTADKDFNWFAIGDR